MERALSHTAASALRLDTIQRQAKALTPHQKRVLKVLERKGGWVPPYELGYPTRPLVGRLYQAGLVKLGPSSSYDPFNCNLSITDNGRAVLSARRK